ncbi:MAG TPA: GNAT family N-acetyltransferase [Actinomycetota bacterium]
MTQFFTFEERPDLAKRYWDESGPWWPPHMEFMNHDPVCNAYWRRLATEFGSFQFVAYDDEDDRFLAHCNTIPFAWTGRDDDLPAGVPAVLERSFAEASEGTAPTTVCALLALIQPDARSKGLASQLLLFMKEIGRRQGLQWLVAPVRPNLKESYPITPMERYVEWRREDGLMFDPWLRTHERLGARYAGIASRGNIFRGAISEWEEWTGLTFPESGEFVVRGALNPVMIDRERDEGLLTEPNVWMIHTIDG